MTPNACAHLTKTQVHVAAMSLTLGFVVYLPKTLCDECLDRVHDAAEALHDTHARKPATTETNHVT